MHLIDRLAHDNRLAHRHPSEKLVLAGGMLCLSLLLPPWPGAPVVFAVMAAASLGIARIGFWDYLAVLALPGGFLFAGLAVMPLSLTMGEGGVSVSLSPAGIDTAIDTGLRAVAAVSCLTFLAITTPMADVLWLLRRLRVPVAVIDIMLLTYRFLLALMDSATKGMVAQEARLGWSTRRRRVRSIGMLAATLLPRTLDRARRLELGLAARDFTGVLTVLSNRLPPSRTVLAAVAGLEAAVALGFLWPA